MVYAYCTACGSIHEARIVAKRFLLGKSIVCQTCKEKVTGRLIQKTCEVCGNTLYVPPEHAELEPPCKKIHEQEQNAARMEEEKKERENRLRFSMREIPCQHCPDVILRLKNGKYERCPNCGNEPSAEYLMRKWEDITSQRPGLIRWADLAGERLIHVDQRAENIPPYSILLVAPGTYVQYSSDGTDWRTLGNGRYALFRDERTEEEKILLANQNDQLLLGLATRIVFFNEAVCGHECRISVCLGGGRWKVTIPMTIHMQISKDNVVRFMGYNWNLTDDRRLTEQVKSIVENTITGQIEQFILEREQADDAVEEFASENDVMLWCRGAFSLRNRQRITNEVEQELFGTYGITLPNPITIARVEISDLHHTQAVECTYCNHVNHIPTDTYIHQEDFKCEACGSNMLWCNTCKRYVTNQERYPARYCDIGHHMTW